MKKMLVAATMLATWMASTSALAEPRMVLMEKLTNTA